MSLPTFISVPGASALATLLLLAPAGARQGPDSSDLFLHAGDPDFQYLWGGELREVFAWAEAGNPTHRRVWVCEDGGRIRLYDSAATPQWQFQSVPTTNVLLDVFFLANGDTGWACGKGGVLLKTLDHGQSWTVQDAQVPTSGDEAKLWAVCFLDGMTGVLGGEHVFKRSPDGGQSWTSDIVIAPGSNCGLAPTDLEIYAFDVVRVGTSIRVICAAEPGVLLISEDPTLQNWRFAQMTGGGWACNLESANGELELWDVSVAPAPTQFDTTLVIAAGGIGSALGSIYVSADSGQTWAKEFGNTLSTHYGVETLASGNAIAVGYAGRIYRRVFNPGVNWIVVPNREAVPPPPPNTFTGPLSAVDSDGASDVWAVGSWGYIRHSATYGTVGSWYDEQPYAEVDLDEYRVRACHFADDAEGWIVGQFERIDKIHFNDGTPGHWTWTKQNPANMQSTVILEDVAFADLQHGLAVGSEGILHWTADGGATPWNRQVVAAADLKAVAWGGSGHFWVAGGGGTLLHVTLTGQGPPSIETITLPSGQTIASANLEDLVFVSSTTAYIVGSSPGAQTVGRAWKMTNALNPATRAFVERSPTFNNGAIVGLDGGRELLDVEARLGGGLPEVYACGKKGVVLKYNYGAGEFVCAAPAYVCDPATGLEQSAYTDMDFLAVGMPLSSAEVFVAPLASEDDVNTGRVLRFDGTSWTLPWPKCQTTKAIRDFSFPQAGLGFAAAHSNTAEPVGNVGDSALILWRP